MADLGASSYQPRQPVWIAAATARTPLGATAASSAAAVRAGLSALAEHAGFTDQQGEPVRLASDAFLLPGMTRAERLSALLAAPLDQLPPLGTARLLVILCLAEPDAVQPESRPALAQAVAARWPGARVQVLPEGHAAGLLAFGIAARALDEGVVDAVVVAGVESRQDRAVIDGLDRAGELKSETNRDGFFPGEAAGACLLAGTATLRGLALAAIGRLAGVATAVEPVPIRATEGICTGEGLSAAILALSPLIGDRPVSDTWCDINGQRYRSEERLYTVLRSQAMFLDAVECTHPADCWGDVGAASGPLLAALALSAQAKGYAKGARALIWASSEGGRRAAVILDAMEGRT